MTRFTSYIPDRNDRPLPPLPQPEVNHAVGLAASMNAANYYAARMTQPDYSMIIIRGSQGVYEVQDDWTGIWTPMSIQLINPYNFPIYIAANGNAESNGIPFPPQTSLRIPLAGQQGSFVLAADPTQLADNDAIVHLFRYATPE